MSENVTPSREPWSVTSRSAPLAANCTVMSTASPQVITPLEAVTAIAAAGAPTLNGSETAGVRAPFGSVGTDTAMSVYPFPGLSIRQPLKVAIPLTVAVGLLVHVSVPAPGLFAIDSATVNTIPPVTALPMASTTPTCGSVGNEVLAAASPSAVRNASRAGGPTATVNGLPAAPVCIDSPASGETNGAPTVTRGARDAMSATATPIRTSRLAMAQQPRNIPRSPRTATRLYAHPGHAALDCMAGLARAGTRPLPNPTAFSVVR